MTDVGCIPKKMELLKANSELSIKRTGSGNRLMEPSRRKSEPAFLNAFLPACLPSRPHRIRVHLGIVRGSLRELRTNLPIKRSSLKKCTPFYGAIHATYLEPFPEDCFLPLLLDITSCCLFRVANTLWLINEVGKGGRRTARTSLLCFRD